MKIVLIALVLVGQAHAATSSWVDGTALCNINGVVYDVPMPQNSTAKEVVDYCEYLETVDAEEREIQANDVVGEE